MAFHHGQTFNSALNFVSVFIRVSHIRLFTAAEETLDDFLRVLSL